MARRMNWDKARADRLTATRGYEPVWTGAPPRTDRARARTDAARPLKRQRRAKSQLAGSPRVDGRRAKTRKPSHAFLRHIETKNKG
jgi:hypothetical protein